MYTSNIREAARKGDTDSLHEAYRVLGRASQFIDNGEHAAAITAIADVRYLVRAFLGESLEQAAAIEARR